MGELSKTTINGVSYDFKDAGAARQSHSHTKSQITDFPTLGTAASKNVPSSGNASTSQVVMGNDSRLSDARTPTSHTHTKSQITDFPTLGTASAKDVPSSGNASTSQVVMGNDSRLSDARTPTSHTHTKSQITDFPTSMPASDVYSWAKQSSKPSYTASEVGAIATSAKGAANGVASLDSAGKVPSSQLPSYVDDVLEYSSKSSFPSTGETGKIYVDTTTNKTYRWSGSAYVEISASLALGETSSTAYYGDKGKTAYNHSQVTSGNPHNVTKSDVGLGNVGNFKAVSTVASQGLSDTEKSNARANIGAGTGNGTYSKPSGGIPKTDLASAVQTSLGKADSALQSFTETDPTVPSWAKQSSKPSYTQDEVSDGTTYKRVTSTEKNTWNSKGTYSKPSGGIPKSDLASAVQTSLGLADSALQSHQTIKQDGVTGATINRFGTCGTAAATAAKTVSITTGTFTLEAGARVTVKFSNANTAGTPTLNVNSTGAKNIYSKGSQITTGNNKSLLAGTVDFIYDGTQYHLIGNYIDTNTTYSSKSAASGGTDVSLCTTGEKYTWNTKGTYSKPSGGIPKTDLASAVQTSLGKADSALQSFTESDPTVPSWAKQSSKPSYTASEVGALALTGNTITGDIQRKQTEIDASKANNNISATKYPTTYSIIDNSGRIMVRNEAIVEPSGNISWYAYVRNYNTSGGQVAQKGIKYTVNKSGAGTWTVDDATSFKSAIGLADLSKLFSPTYVQPTKHSNITSIDDGGYIQIGKLTILNMRFTVGTECGQWTDIFTDCPLPLSSLSGGYGVVACSSNTNQAFAICANGRLQNYSGTLNPGSYVVSACYMTQ